MLQVAENQLYFRTRKTEVDCDFAFIGPRAQQLFDAIGKFPQTPRKRRIGNVITMRLPGIAKVDEFWVEPVFPPPMPQQFEKPLLEAAGDDPWRTVGGIVARREDRTACRPADGIPGRCRPSGGWGCPAQTSSLAERSYRAHGQTESWGRSRRSDGSTGPAPNSPLESMSQARSPGGKR